MIGLIRSEAIKAFAVKTWWVMLLLGAVLTALSCLPILLVVNVGADEFGGEFDQLLTGPDLLRQVWSVIGSAGVIALILGILSFTGEYRHETITATFLTEPRRIRVILAKAAVTALQAVFLTIVAAVVVVVLALWLLPDTTAAIAWGDLGQTILAVLVTYILYAVLGVAVGALLINPIVAIVLGVLWMLFLESLISALRPMWAPWLPGGAAQAILGTPPFGLSFEPLSPALGVVVLLGYAVVFAAVAAATTLRRDIT